MNGLQGQGIQAKRILDKGITVDVVVTTPTGNKTLHFVNGVLVSIT